MRSYEPSEFLARLAADDLDDPADLTLYGLVKPDAEDPPALLFGLSPSCEPWIRIPAAAISSVKHARNLTCGDHQHPFVRIVLQAPPQSDAAAFLFMRLFAQARTAAAAARVRAVGPDGPAAAADCETFTFDDVPYACCPPASGSGPWECLIAV